MSELISLKCPHCGTPLLGENNSHLFFCRSCDRGWDVEREENRLQEYPLAYAKAGNEMKLAGRYFPFWRIEIPYALTEPATQEKESGVRISFVPAFFIKNINYFGDIGFFYTQKKIQVEMEHKRDYVIFPADRGLKDALAYPLVYFFKERSLSRSVEKTEIRLEPGLASLLLIPFFRSDKEYIDSLILWKYPPGALI